MSTEGESNEIVRLGEGFKMTELQREALTYLTPDFFMEIDPVVLVRNLYSLGFVNAEFLDFVEMSSTNKTTISGVKLVLLEKLPVKCSVSQFICGLEKSGYESFIIKYYHYCYLLKSFLQKEMCRTDVGDQKVVSVMSTNLKRGIHNRTVTKAALRQLAKKFDRKFQSEEGILKKQKLADICIGILGVEIDAKINFEGESQQSRDALFRKMMRYIPHMSNTAIGDIMLYGRLANERSMRGDFEKADDQMKVALLRARQTGRCPQLTNMFFLGLLVRLWEFEESPTRESLNRFMDIANVGLESSRGLEEPIQLFWKRLFLSRMVFCLIGLGYRANIIGGWNPEDIHIQKAEKLLNDLNKIQEGVEKKRVMFLLTAKARLSELKGHHVEAVVKAKEAVTIAREGEFEELEYIEQYLNNVLIPEQQRTDQTRSSFEQISDQPFASLNLGEDNFAPEGEMKDNVNDQYVGQADNVRSFTTLDLSSLQAEIVPFPGEEEIERTATPMGTSLGNSSATQRLLHDKKSVSGRDKTKDGEMTKFSILEEPGVDRSLQSSQPDVENAVKIETADSEAERAELDNVNVIDVSLTERRVDAHSNVFEGELSMYLFSENVHFGSLFDTEGGERVGNGSRVHFRYNNNTNNNNN